MCEHHHGGYCMFLGVLKTCQFLILPGKLGHEPNKRWQISDASPAQEEVKDLLIKSLIYLFL